MKIYISTWCFYPSLIIACTCHVGSFVPRMFTDPNSMKYLREERALIGRNRCLAGIIIGSLHRLELILPDESRGLVKWREISTKLSRSREISRQKRYPPSETRETRQTLRFARNRELLFPLFCTNVSNFIAGRSYSREGSYLRTVTTSWRLAHHMPR